MSKMTRMSEEASKSLDFLAELMGKPKQAILERALEEFLRKEFIKKANEEYALLKENKEEWNKFVEENEEWDVALQDGLEPYE